MINILYYFSMIYFVIFYILFFYYINRNKKNYIIIILTLQSKNVSLLSATRKPNVSHNIYHNNINERIYKILLVMYC